MQHQKHQPCESLMFILCSRSMPCHFLSTYPFLSAPAQRAGCTAGSTQNPVACLIACVSLYEHATGLSLFVVTLQDAVLPASGKDQFRHCARMKHSSRANRATARRVCDQNIWLASIVLSPHFSNPRLLAAAACHLLHSSGFRSATWLLFLPCCLYSVCHWLSS